MKKERAPAQIVSCPHCSWKGSARGLFTHCRMAHPNYPTPETKGKRIWATVHPQSVNPVIGQKKRKKGNSRWTDNDENRYQRLLRIMELYFITKTPGPVTQLAGIPDKEDEVLAFAEELRSMHIQRQSFRARG